MININIGFLVNELCFNVCNEHVAQTFSFKHEDAFCIILYSEISSEFKCWDILRIDLIKLISGKRIRVRNF